MQRLVARLALVVLAVVATAGCNIVLTPVTPPVGGSGPTCLPGTWAFQSEQIQSPINTPFGALNIATSGTGTTLTFTDTTWTLDTDTVLDASITTQLGTFSGHVEIKGDATGTYTADGTNITFTLGNVMGTVTYDVNVLGHDFSGTLTLPSSGMQNLVGLSGTAPYSCSSSGLTFTLKPMKVEATHQ
jgi:hypothetical protein